MTVKNTSIAELKVIKQLVIGPARLNRNRLVVPYKVYTHNKVDETSLIYKYEENVFQPDSPDDQNLANMIAAPGGV